MTKLPNMGDDFSRITAELELQIVDPLIEQVRQRAMEFDLEIRELPPESRADAKEQKLREMDKLWPYRNMNVRVSGQCSVPGEEGRYTSARIDERVVRSRGFTYLVAQYEQSGELIDRIYYEFEADDIDGSGTRAIIVALPEHIDAFQLPFCSEALRVRRFAYDRATDAAYIDELIHRAESPDQALKALADYYLEIDIEKNPDDQETARDATAFLRDRVALEEYASYDMTIAGDFLLFDTDDTARPGNLRQPISGIGTIRDVLLYTADHSDDQVTRGSQILIPHLDIVLFNRKDRTKDRRMLVPCQSFQAIKSVRYRD